MEDREIIKLYWDRDQLAITETASKYGRFVQSIAMNILADRCDSEECVNDTYHRAWITMPPVKPDSLAAYLGKIVRNISISLYRRKHAAKRDAGAGILISELEECVADKNDVESHMEAGFLTDAINRWLHVQKEEDMALFVKRYWNCESVEQIAEQWNMKAGRLSVKLFRLRKSLKAYLEKEGIAV